jgi:hypothetical protein
LDQHSGEYELQINTPNLPSGDYILTIVYGEPNYTEPNSRLVIQGFSINTDPNTAISITGDLNFDEYVDWADLKELLDSWLSPIPLSEKDLFTDGIINLKDFVIFTEHWLEGTTL